MLSPGLVRTCGTCSLFVLVSSYAVNFFVAWSGGLGHQKHVCYTPSFIMMAKVIADETVLGPDLLVIIVGLQAKT